MTYRVRNFVGGLVVVAILALIITAVAVDETRGGETTPAAGAPAFETEFEAPWPMVAFLGDSFTTGAKAGTQKDRYPALICSAKQWTCLVNGQGATGFVSAGQPEQGESPYINRIPALRKDGEPELIVIQGGINDPGDATVEPAVRATLAAAKAEYPTAQIVALGPIQPLKRSPKAIEANRAAMAAAAEAEGVRFIDPIAGNWITDPTLFADDGMHLTAAGYNVFATKLSPELYIEDGEAGQ